MVVSILNLTRWEWFKIRHRWLPWILLIVVVVFAQFGFWLGYAAYHNETLQELISGSVNSYGVSTEIDGETVSMEVSCVDLVEGRMPLGLDRLPEEDRQEILQDLERFRAESCGGTNARESFREIFVLPSAMSEMMVGTLGIAPILIMILGGSIVGAEYGMGTLRTVLTKGIGRWPLLTSKFALIVLAAAAVLVAVSVVTVVASLLAAVIPPSEDGGVADVGKWSDVLITFGKSLYALAPYAALGGLLAVLTQSSAVSISVSLGYYVVELIVTPLMRVNETLEKFTDFILGGSVSNWMQAEFVSVEVNNQGGLSEQPETMQAFLVLLAYIVVFVAVALWVFQRRDIAGAKGE